MTSKHPKRKTTKKPAAPPTTYPARLGSIGCAVKELATVLHTQQAYLSASDFRCNALNTACTALEMLEDTIAACGAFEDYPHIAHIADVAVGPDPEFVKTYSESLGAQEPVSVPSPNTDPFANE